LKAYNNATELIASQTISADDSGTGDGIATLFSVSASSANPIGYIILDVPDECGFAIDDFSFTPVPEPATFLLLGTGLLGIAHLGHRRLKKK